MGLNAPQRLWSDDDRHKVAGLLVDGASASEVGKAMQLTRNAAIGRIMRDKELHQLMSRRPRQHHPVMHRPITHLHTSARRVEPLLPPPEEEAEPNPGLLMPIADTGSQWCKWPVKQAPEEVPGGYWCCGAPVGRGDVYCPHHRKIARRV